MKSGSVDGELEELNLGFAVAAVETGTLSVAAAVLMKAGFGSRNGAVKAVADGEADFEDVKGLLRWVKSDPVVELGGNPDWPTVETHELWTAFVEGVGTTRFVRWRMSDAEVPVRWYDPGWIEVACR